MNFTILQNDLGIRLTGLAKKNVASPVPFEFLILQDLLNMHGISGLTTGGLSEIQIMAILKFYRHVYLKRLFNGTFVDFPRQSG